MVARDMPLTPNPSPTKGERGAGTSFSPFSLNGRRVGDEGGAGLSVSLISLQQQ